mmetsp:Transcript_37654/g.59545  ORF Transcript_37654/g.59545 Transcript_37654/m.59545 type:complete len:464 (-) Transcript_37654:19-1410(-)
MATLSPVEVEQWLLGLKSLLSGEAVRELANEVRRNQMDGVAFGALVASRSTPANLSEVVKPSHMATLRRCWNSERPQGKGDRERRNNVDRRDEPRNDRSRQIVQESPGFWDAPSPAKQPQQGTGKQKQETRKQAEPDVAKGRQLGFAPPPRGVQAEPIETIDTLVEPEQPPEPSASRETALQKNPMMRRVDPEERERERQPGECYDKVARPPEVPRLDLSALQKENLGRDTDKLGTQQWMKPGGTGPQYPAPHRDRTTAGLPTHEVAPKGFACASCEDQQRIAEFYGYRDEGFVATMHGLKTDCIRPRLYLGSMADAAYWPLLQSLCITHILNCAIEAQRSDPPYESQGVKYMRMPWQDTPEQAHSLQRQKFKQLRECTRFIDQSMKATFQVGGVEKKASVLVHCVQGMNRSAAIVCAYLMEYEDVGLDRALAEVRGKHKGCLSSRHWQDFLHKFDAELLRGM